VNPFERRARCYDARPDFDLSGLRFMAEGEPFTYPYRCANCQGIRTLHELTDGVFENLGRHGATRFAPFCERCNRLWDEMCEAEVRAAEAQDAWFAAGCPAE
jgi:hypothetical protein